MLSNNVRQRPIDVISRGGCPHDNLDRDIVGYSLGESYHFHEEHFRSPIPFITNSFLSFSPNVSLALFLPRSFPSSLSLSFHPSS